MRQCWRGRGILGASRVRIRHFGITQEPIVAHEVSERVTAAEKHFAPPQTLRHASISCYNQYKRNSHNLIEDLLLHYQLADFSDITVMARYNESLSVRALVLLQLFELYKRNEDEQVLKYLAKMRDHRALSKQATTGLRAYYNVKVKLKRTFLFDLIVQETVFSGEPLLAVSFLLDGRALMETTSRRHTASLIIRALSVNKPGNDTYHAYTILLVLDRFGTVVDPKDYAVAIDYAMSLPACPYLANLIAEKFLLLDLADTPLVLKTLNRLVVRNLEYHNVRAALRIWEKIPKHIPLSTVGLLHYFNEELNKSDLSLLGPVLERVQKKALRPAVVDILVKLLSRVGDLEKVLELTLRYRAPLNRLELSALLQQSCDEDDSQRAQRILQTLTSASFKVTPEDIGSVVSMLLRVGAMDEAAAMLVQTPNVDAGKGHVAMVNHVLKYIDLEETDNNWLGKAARALRGFSSNEILDDLFFVALQYVQRGRGLREAKRFYVAYSTGHETQLSLGRLEPLRTVLVLPEMAKLRCLQHILLAAIDKGDHTTVKWAFGEMRAVGAFAEDITSIIRDHNSDYADHLSV